MSGREEMTDHETAERERAERTLSIESELGDADAYERVTSVEDVAWLLAENVRLRRLTEDALANLTRTQETSSRYVNGLRGFRFFEKEQQQEAFTGIIGAAYSAVCKHGSFFPRLLNIKDGTGDAEAKVFCGLAQDACTRAETNGGLTWRLLAEEEFSEALAESDPRKLKAELEQACSVLSAWITAIEIREASK